jgi:hypothetical protein
LERANIGMTMERNKTNQKYFPAQAPSEEVFLLIRRHWMTYTIFWVLLFLMIIPLVLVFALTVLYPDFFTEAIMGIAVVAGSAYCLIILALLLYGFVDFYLDVYIVTDRRIVDIKQDGFFKRAISELNLRQIQDVNAKVEGLFPTLFHYGDVYIQTAGEAENFVFQSIPHPYRISKKIIDLYETHLRTRGEYDTSVKQKDMIFDREVDEKS